MNKTVSSNPVVRVTPAKSAMNTSTPTREDAQKLLLKLSYEFSMMKASEVRVSDRITKLNDITNRVKFAKRKSADQQKFLNRLRNAHREHKNLLTDMANVSEQFENLKKTLESEGA